MNPTTNPDKFTYLGDGVYARFDGFGIWTVTQRDDGWHEIYFEPGVLAQLNRFAKERS